MVIHSTDRPFLLCKECPEKIRTRAQLTLHVSDIHKRFECYQCHKMCTKNYLIKHMKHEYPISFAQSKISSIEMKMRACRVVISRIIVNQ